MEEIIEYIKKSYEDRTNHLDLDSPCREIGGTSTHFKGLLSYILNVTIPFGNKIHLCHKCHNKKCSNPNHLYYGTPKENMNDQMESGTYTTIWKRMVEKYGIEEATKRQVRNFTIASKSGKGNIGKSKSEQHKKNISNSIKRNWKKRKMAQ